jgi:hypothetical protein
VDTVYELKKLQIDPKLKNSAVTALVIDVRQFKVFKGNRWGTSLKAAKKQVVMKN